MFGPAPLKTSVDGSRRDTLFIQAVCPFCWRRASRSAMEPPAGSPAAWAAPGGEDDPGWASSGSEVSLVAAGGGAGAAPVAGNGCVAKRRAMASSGTWPFGALPPPTALRLRLLLSWAGVNTCSFLPRDSVSWRWCARRSGSLKTENFGREKRSPS